MSTSQLNTQSAVARRSAEAQLRELIAKFSPAHQSLVGAMRRWLRKRLPAAHELVYEYRDCFVISYSPSERGYEGVLAIRASADGVRLYFNRGKELPDPEKLLRGSANARWIQLEGASTLARPAVARLFDEAIAHNRVPFARAGRGPLVIRSVSAKQRQSRPRAAQVATAKGLSAVRSSVAGVPNSAVQRTQAEGQLESFIAKFEPKRQTLIRSVRKVLRRRFPTAHELVYDNYNFFVIGYCPTERPSDCLVSIAAAANGVGLCFTHGASLPDPKKVLVGSGKQTRFLRLESAAILDRPEVKALFKVAVMKAKVSMPSTGRGQLIIRSVSAKQRPRR